MFWHGKYPGGGGLPEKIGIGVRPASQAFNGVEEGKARMGEGGRDEEVASSKKKNRIED